MTTIEDDVADYPQEYAKGGLIPGWVTGYIDKSDMYVQPYLGTVENAPWVVFSESAYSPATWTDVAPTIPEALCPNCRRDRHDFPLSERVAEMWKSLAFTDYDPADDVSRIVCPGSDVCGPALAEPSRWNSGYYMTTMYAFDEPLSMTAYTWLPEGKLPEAFTPVPQAAIEAAPKQLEHLAPQSPGFDFASTKTDHQPTYPGKKKHK